MANVFAAKNGYAPSPSAAALPALLGMIGGCASPDPAGANAPKVAPRPNIVLVMADDMGWGDWAWGASAGVSRNGDPVHPHLQTPNLDRLAASGTTFDRFYAAAPVCSPTRGSCLTGRHPLRYGIRGANSGHLLESEHTLPEIMQGAGYATGFFGKWHLGTFTTTERDSNRGGRPAHAQHFNPPGRHGFDEWFATEAKVPTYDPMVHPDTGAPYGTAYWRTDGTRETSGLEGDDSRVIMDRALPFVRRAVEQNTPFFTVIWLHTPHLPVVAGSADRAAYAGIDTGSNAGQRRERHEYWACMTALDRQVGRLLDTLDQLSARENTVVWFASDNGPEGKHNAPGQTGGLRGRKRSLYEGGVRVPGVVSWPAQLAAGARATAAGFTSDIMPTVLDWTGLAPPETHLDGASLASHMPARDPRDEGGQPRPPFGFMSAKQTSWIDGSWKLIGTLPKAWGDGEVVRWELYDLVTDPGEQNDRAGERPARAAAMAAAWRAWRQTF